MKIPDLSRRSSHTTIAARTVILVTFLQGVVSAQTSPPPQTDTECTLSNGTVSGPFGGYDVSGSFSGPTGGVPTTSSITVNGPGIPYSYTFTGPLNGPGYIQPSEIPPSPCDILGCPPGGNPPGYAGLHVSPNDENTTAALAFTDTGEPFDGLANLSCNVTGTPPPNPCTDSAEDRAAGHLRPRDETCPVCVAPGGDLPDGEAWDATHPSIVDFKQELYGGGALSISMVRERNAATGSDSCWFSGSAFAAITTVNGDQWTVNQPPLGGALGGFPTWGPDQVGWRDDPDPAHGLSFGAVTYYRVKKRVPCGYAVYQQMQYQCQLVTNWFNYGFVNTLSGYITATTVTARKHDIQLTRRY